MTMPPDGGRTSSWPYGIGERTGHGRRTWPRAGPRDAVGQLDDDAAGRVADREQGWRAESTGLGRDDAAHRDDRADRLAARVRRS